MKKEHRIKVKLENQRKLSSATSDLGFMNVPELSAYLNITESFVRSLVFKKEIPVIRIGKCLRFSKVQIIDWLNNNGAKI